jgi:hypothetical protein
LCKYNLISAIITFTTITFIFRLTRELLVVYLDEDLLVVRDYLGSPEILRRVASVEDASSSL